MSFLIKKDSNSKRVELGKKIHLNSENEIKFTLGYLYINGDFESVEYNQFVVKGKLENIICMASKDFMPQKNELYDFLSVS